MTPTQNEAPQNALVLANQQKTSFEEITSIAKVYAASGFYADAKQMAQAAAKILAGRSLGLSDSAAMSGIYIVKGRVTLSATLMGAVIQASGRFRYRVEEMTAQKCVIRFEERDLDSRKWEPVGVSSFSMEDAKVAGLTSNPTYRSYPRNMLFARALSNGARWFCPAIFGGSPVYLPDELPGSPVKLTSVDDSGEHYEVQDVEVVGSSREEDLRELRDLLGRTSTPEAKVLKKFGLSTLDAIGEAELSEALTALRAKAA